MRLLAILIIIYSSITNLYAQDFSLTSPDIKSNEMIDKKFEFNGFGCIGENKSPSLSWDNPPKGTKSYAVTMYDKDAPTGSGWWHWIVVNIPNNVSKLSAGAGDFSGKNLPKSATHIRNDYGTYSFGGVCPPVGDKKHEYKFTIFALDTDKLDLPKNPSAALTGYMLGTHTIKKASFIAYYKR